MNVLIVDDEQEFVDVLADVLRRSGHTVEGAVDAAAALRDKDLAAYDVLVLDMVMPGMTGAEFFAELRRRGSPLVHRTVVVSGYLTPAVRGAFPELPDHAFLQKPFSILELRSLLDQLVSADGG
jgi:CheY-like chemotaxis protein